MPDQTAQNIVKLAQEPVNNLVVVMAIISIIAVIVAVLGIGVLIWKFAPVLFTQIKQTIENSRQQTEINKQQASILERLTAHSEKSEKTAEDNNAELVKQTIVLNQLNDATKVQNIDFKAYQTLVSDNMANHSSQVAANTEKIGVMAESIDGIKESIEDLSNQIRAILENHVDIVGLEEIVKKLSTDFTAFLITMQSKNVTTINLNGESTTP